MRSFLQFLATSFLSDNTIFLRTLISKILSLYHSLSMKNQVSHTHTRVKKTDKIRVIHILNFIFWIAKAKQNIMDRMIAGSSNCSKFFMKAILIL